METDKNDIVNQIIDLLHRSEADYIEWAMTTTEDLKITLRVEDLHDANE